MTTLLGSVVSWLQPGFVGSLFGLQGAPPANPASGLRLDLLALGAFIVVGGLVGLWFVSRKAPRGTVLTISGVVYAITWIVPWPASREMTVIGGALRLLGFVGGFLGLIELLRGPAREKPLLAEVVVEADAERRPAEVNDADR